MNEVIFAPQNLFSSDVNLDVTKNFLKAHIDTLRLAWHYVRVMGIFIGASFVKKRE